MVRVKIVNVMSAMDIDPSGRFVKIYRVEYTVDDKISDWLDVPADKFSESYVKSEIIRKVEELQKLGIVPKGEIEFVSE